MEIRNMFKNIFGKGDNLPEKTTTFKMLDSYEDFFTPAPGYSINDTTVRTCIDTIARNCAKMGINHIRVKDGKSYPQRGVLQELLTCRPNEYMSTYDFIYKIISQLYTYNNAFIYIKTNGGAITGLYPLSYQSLELREANSQLMVKFGFMNGHNKTIPYSELIHIRRHFNEHDILGDTASQQGITNSINILNALKSAMQNAVKNSTRLRGYLKTLQQLNPKHQDSILTDFVSKFLGSESKYGGIAILDQTADYIPLNADFKTMDGEQMDFMRNEVYRYFGLNENIIKSDFTADSYNSFFESIIEPLAVQLSQEFTNKLFTAREKDFGNRIIFTCDKLQYASLKDKVELIRQLQPAGFITTNEGRELFGFSPIEGGDERIISLNHIKASDMSLYQTGREDNKNDGQKI